MSIEINYGGVIEAIVKPVTAPGPWVQMMNVKTDMHVHYYDMTSTATVVGEVDEHTYIIEYDGKKFWSPKDQWEQA